MNKYGDQNALYLVADSASSIKSIVQPLADCKWVMENELSPNMKVRKSKGLYSNRMMVRFKVKSVNELTVIPSDSVQAYVPQLTHLVMVQHSGDMTTITLLVGGQMFCWSSALFKAIIKMVKNMCPNGDNFIMTPTKVSVARMTIEHMRVQCLLFANHQQALKMIDHYPSVVQKFLCKSLSLDVIDVERFWKQVTEQFKNLLFTTQSDDIRVMQASNGDEDYRWESLRLSDNRALIDEYFNVAYDNVKKGNDFNEIEQLFSQQQKVMTFDKLKGDLTYIFNSFVFAGYGTQLVTPHPVRILTEQTNKLMTVSCFDFSMYSFRATSCNMCQVAYYIAKNFLSDDQFRSSDKGTMLLAGAPGSGKSLILELIRQFFNGMQITPAVNDIADFQNSEIIFKSCVTIGELDIKLLLKNEWKQFTDINDWVDCKVKYKDSIKYSKGVPVVAATNQDIATELIGQKLENPLYEAICRRIGMIRFLDNFFQSHSSLFASQGQLKAQFKDLYSGNSYNYQMFNTLIAIALSETDTNFVNYMYVIPYYAHVLESFSQTIFGFIWFSQLMVRQIVKHLRTESQETSNMDYINICDAMTTQTEQHIYRILSGLTVGSLYGLSDQQKVLIMGVLNDHDSEFYLKMYNLTQLGCFMNIIKSEGKAVMRQYLGDNVLKNDIYQCIIDQLELSGLQTDEEFMIEDEIPLTQEIADRMSQKYIKDLCSQDSYDIEDEEEKVPYDGGLANQVDLCDQFLVDSRQPFQSQQKPMERSDSYYKQQLDQL